MISGTPKALRTVLEISLQIPDSTAQPETFPVPIDHSKRVFSESSSKTSAQDRAVRVQDAKRRVFECILDAVPVGRANVGDDDF